eukprot:2513334-Pyramimonas_sp.AAC.1
MGSFWEPMCSHAGLYEVPFGNLRVPMRDSMRFHSGIYGTICGNLWWVPVRESMDPFGDLRAPMRESMGFCAGIRRSPSGVYGPLCGNPGMPRMPRVAAVRMRLPHQLRLARFRAPGGTPLERAHTT